MLSVTVSMAWYIRYFVLRSVIRSEQFENRKSAKPGNQGNFPRSINLALNISDGPYRDKM